MAPTHKAFRKILDDAYATANAMVESETPHPQLDSVEVSAASSLAKIKHACRGVALTLLAYKLADPSQDIRAHKDEYVGGFSARGIDTKVTIPFLIDHSLPRNVETHWLTQTLSFAPPFDSNCILKTTPKKCGPLLIEIVGHAESGSPEIVQAMLEALIYELIKIRNADKVVLTRPKNLSIDKVQQLIHSHFRRRYKSSAPRLPQLAVYAVYQSLLPHVDRYSGQELNAIDRLKSADRKKGAVGDIVVSENGEPVEAVEIKFEKSITATDVEEAIDKVRSASVRRYYLLSTRGISVDDIETISTRKADFLEQNGCEIIVNGVIETIGYYLRLLPDTTAFLSNYASLVEGDDDTSYEHRIAWNECCTNL
jgi:DNA (cytosine-5)-methyltransferase 1